MLTKKTIEELAHFVRQSTGTQLYLIAAVCIHEPYRNTKFGPPPEVVKSLWKGLSIWRIWRQYIQLMPELTLTNNFTSYAHYMTEELLVHAGINHLLTLYLLFPHLSTEEYSLRYTGNRGIEAVHSIFRGGTSNLPITGANLSFGEFLTLMNKAVQASSVEHELKKLKETLLSHPKKEEKLMLKRVWMHHQRLLHRTRSLTHTVNLLKI